VFTAQETASGSFRGTFSLLDYGAAGVGPGTTVLAPVSYTITGLTGLGTASAVAPGFRTATSSAFTGHVRFDNFAVDPPPAAKLAYLQQPSAGTAGVALSPFIVAVQDIAGHTVSSDASTVTLTLSHGTFANGATSVSATAIDGVATFNNLVINTSGSYVLRATDTNPNLDPGYAPFTINAGVAAKLAFVQQPTNTSAGATITPAVTVAVEDANGNTVTSDTSAVTLTLSSSTFAGGSTTATANAVGGVATFNNLVINAAGTYTLAASDGSLTGATSAAFTISSSTPSITTGATPTTQNVVQNAAIQTVTITATDYYANGSALAISGTYTYNGGAAQALPSSMLVLTSTTPDGTLPGQCTWTFSGTAAVALGTYVVTVTVTDGQLWGSVTFTIIVTS
jgi:hypothetical protein